MKELLIKYRRDLHQIPEIGFELYKTREYILEVLKQRNCETTEISGGIIAFFQSREDGGNGTPREKTIALRGDMDALPVTEQTGAPYRSLHEGVMHACGHDGHMAMLLALAGELDKIIHTLPHNVLLIFQPAEETSGGAEDMCATGFMEKYNVKQVFGFHLWPTLPKNVIGSRVNEFMAQASELDIFIEGKSTHCATADQGIDALAIGCELVGELYKMEKTEFPASEYRLLKVGKFESGTARNIISGRTVLELSVRCFHEETGNYMFRRIGEISDSFQERTGCRITFHRTDGHPALLNDPVLFEEAKKLLSTEYEFYTYERPFMLAEDFSSFLKRAPGLFLYLGTGTNIPLHSNNYDLDEDVLLTGVEIYLKLLKSVSV